MRLQIAYDIAWAQERKNRIEIKRYESQLA